MPGRIPARAVAIVTACVSMLGCATGSLATRAGKDLALHAREAHRDEPDLEIARVSGYANLKLLETLHRADPGDPELLLALAEGFAAATLVFAEEEAAEARCAGDESTTGPAGDRLGALYARAREYAVRTLEHRLPRAREALRLSPPRLSAWLAGETTAGDAAPLLWLAVAWLGELGAEAESTDPRDLGRVRALLERIVALDGTLRYGAPHLLIGVLDASVPARASASADRGASSFERALAASDGRLLLARVERARTLLVALDDRPRFEAELHQVLTAPADIIPGERLLTAMAKRRARRLLRGADALFSSERREVHAYHRIPCND